MPFFMYLIVILVVLMSVSGDSLDDSRVAAIDTLREMATPTKAELHQGSKLASNFAKITSIDKIVHRDMYNFLVKKFGVYQLEKKTVLIVGARLGGEVSAFTRLGALAIGYDVMPGPRNPWVVYGNGNPIQFASGTFDVVWCNIIDHIPDRPQLFLEVRRVLKPSGEFYNLVDQNAPDAYSVVDNRGIHNILAMEKNLTVAGFSKTTNVHYDPCPVKTFVSAYLITATK